MRKTFALAALLGSMLCLKAQDNEMDPVTVTTSSTPEKTSRSGRNLFVIQGEKFNDLPVQSIDELLRFLPGIEMQARGPLGAQSDIVLRGGTFQQVLVVLDGLRLNDPNTGHFSAYIPIAPHEIERIEILKGASSAIYGSEAVGGVVHIITKTFSARKGKPALNTGVQLKAGAYDLFSANAGIYFNNGNTSVSAGILSNNTSGQPQRGTNGSVYAHTASFSFGHHFNEKLSMQMRYAYDTRNFSAQNFYTSFISDTAAEKITSFWNQVSIAYNTGRNRLSFSAGFKCLDDEYQYNSMGAPNESNSKMVQALLKDEWKLNDKTTIIIGGQYLNKRILSNDRGRHRVDQAAGFVVVSQQLGNHFFASPALRLEWNERSGWELVPQVNLSYRVRQFQLRGSAGKTIRDADFTERFNNYNKLFVSSGRIGNPDLAPEQSISYEAGADYFLSSLKLSVGFFQRYHRQLIDYVPTPFDEMPRKFNLSPLGSYALAKNIASVKTSGIEADLVYSKTFQNKQEAWATLGIVWLNSVSSNVTPSLYISSHAKFLTNFSFRYRLRRLAFTLNGLYKSRAAQSAPVNIAKIDQDYFVMNLKAEVFAWKNKLAVFVQADNVFDSNYADLLGARMPGRWLMGGIKISLSK